MSALVKKEIRLLLPGFLFSLLMVGAIWLLPDDRRSIFRPLMGESLLLSGAILLMALGTFGREFSAGTFSMLLAQPVTRARIWWTKTSLLAVMVAVVWCVWCICWLHHRPEIDTSGGVIQTMGISTLLFTLAMYSGGLWSVLLFRQVAAAFWFTILIPGAIWMTIGNLSENHGWHAMAGRVQAVALTAYGVAGFLFAMRLFFRAQDAQWTGGYIRMPEMHGMAWRGSAARRDWRPRAALLMKEFQLHQAQYLMAGVLVLLHLGVLAAKKSGTFPINSSLKAVLDAFWTLWLIIPLLAGCSAVAEERKMGTLEGQFCLPVKRRTQFALKYFTVMALSVIFGGAVPLLLEGSRIIPLYNIVFSWCLAALCAGIAAVAFYVSSLARNTLQAIAPAIFGILLTYYLLVAAYIPEMLIRIPLWRGPLIYCIAGPVMTVVLILLTYSNYKRVSPGWSVWRGNLLTVVLSLALAVACTSAIYHRTWELLAPLEPPHGVARLQPGAARLQANGRDITVLLPDGRAWFSRRDFFAPNLFAGKFLEGTNWKDVVALTYDIAGIQRDGSLWVSEKPYLYSTLPDGKITVADFTKLVRMGNEHDWKSIHEYESESLFLLKDDGTLWCWGPGLYWNKNWPGLHSFTPEQLGTDADWAEIFSFFGIRYFRKTNGETWKLLTRWDNSRTWDHYTGQKIFLNQDLALGRVPQMDNHRWKSVFQGGADDFHDFRAGICEDGVFREMAARVDVTTSHPSGWKLMDGDIQIGNETHWLKAIGAYWTGIFSLKADGTLWKWDFKTAPDINPRASSASRFSEHADWVDISGGWDSGFTALAADGSLWLWQFEEKWWYDRSRTHPLLEQSRKPQYLGNIFGNKQ